MPIRTNRGRAAVYRRLWGWPLRSPKHLVITVFVAVVLITALGFLLPKMAGAKHTGAAGTSSSEQTTAPGGGSFTTGGATTTSPLPTRITAPPESLTPAAPPAQAIEVATKWAQAWVNHPAGISNEAWVAALKPYMVEDAVSELAQVDPQNVPATAVTGPAVVKTSYTSEVNVEVPTNALVLTIKVIKAGQAWRVAHYDKVG